MRSIINSLVELPRIRKKKTLTIQSRNCQYLLSQHLTDSKFVLTFEHWIYWIKEMISEHRVWNFSRPGIFGYNCHIIKLGIDSCASYFDLTGLDYSKSVAWVNSPFVPHEDIAIWLWFDSFKPRLQILPLVISISFLVV